MSGSGQPQSFQTGASSRQAHSPLAQAGSFNPHRRSLGTSPRPHPHDKSAVVFNNRAPLFCGSGHRYTSLSVLLRYCKFVANRDGSWNGFMKAEEIDVSVVTPSLNMLSYLKRCVASVADQQGVRAEHLVMDGGSHDGTVEWLAMRPSLVSEVRGDNGMYDAINRGFRRARGRIIAHLNCDEQYLRGTLATVVNYFDTHPDVDVLFGDTLSVRPDGSLVAYRKTIRPLRPVLSLPPLYVPTAATFFRHRLIEDGAFYDDSYKDIADLAWFVRLVSDGYRLAHVRQYLAVFTITGSNRSLNAAAIDREINRFLRGVPWWIRRFHHQWRAVGWGQKLLTGCYFQVTPLEYAIYAPGQSLDRTIFVAQKPSFRWRWQS
jgi:glycosyltransferase involved in cell wall biosynthesis